MLDYGYNYNDHIYICIIDIHKVFRLDDLSLYTK